MIEIDQIIRLLQKLRGHLCSTGVSNTRPANISKKWRFLRKHKSFCLFLQINWFLTHNSKFSIFMRATRPYFESHAARESLWVWDPWCSTYKWCHKHFYIFSTNLSRHLFLKLVKYFMDGPSVFKTYIDW